MYHFSALHFTSHDPYFQYDDQEDSGLPTSWLFIILRIMGIKDKNQTLELNWTHCVPLSQLLLSCVLPNNQIRYWTLLVVHMSEKALWKVEFLICSWQSSFIWLPRYFILWSRQRKLLLVTLLHSCVALLFPLILQISPVESGIR